MLFEWIGNLFVKIPGAVVITGKPTDWQVFLYYGCGVLFLFLQKWKQKKIFLLTLAFGVLYYFCRFIIILICRLPIWTSVREIAAASAQKSYVFN